MCVGGLVTSLRFFALLYLQAMIQRRYLFEGKGTMCSARAFFIFPNQLPSSKLFLKWTTPYLINCGKCRCDSYSEYSSCLCCSCICTWVTPFDLQNRCWLMLIPMFREFFVFRLFSWNYFPNRYPRNCFPNKYLSGAVTWNVFFTCVRSNRHWFFCLCIPGFQFRAELQKNDGGGKSW